MVPMAL